MPAIGRQIIDPLRGTPIAGNGCVDEKLNAAIFQAPRDLVSPPIESALV
jgi:hypothetical protein